MNLISMTNFKVLYLNCYKIPCYDLQVTLTQKLPVYCEIIHLSYEVIIECGSTEVQGMTLSDNYY